jgi:glycosyltransferase involved in cell wall biosynthesis
MPKVILISQKPLPYLNIGSWTTMYKNYFESNSNEIDVILCEEPKKRFENVEYCIVSNNLITKVKRKLTNKSYQNYIDSLAKYASPNRKYIIQVVDNFGFVRALFNYLVKRPKMRKQLYIQFFYHGYPPFFGNFESRWFFEFIDEMVLLTKASYIEHKKSYTILPCLFSVLHNGIDTSKFKQIPYQERNSLRKTFNVHDKTVFLWCSQDRPKKGLDLILKVWKFLIKKYENIELWIIGTERDLQIGHVKVIGKLPNDQLPKYYQMADCYLFPVLNHEGFGMSLIEALNCGNYCIASALGGVPEVLKNGKLGTLIENPHFMREWIDAIESFIENKGEISEPMDVNFYTKEDWIKRMNTIILNAKKTID